MHHLLLKKITKTLGLGWFGVVYSWSLCILGMTNKMTFSPPRENGNFMSSILTCDPFLHRIPTIQRREGTYLSIEKYQ
jgi:hypothetical protein